MIDPDDFLTMIRKEVRAGDRIFTGSLFDHEIRVIFWAEGSWNIKRATMKIDGHEFSVEWIRRNQTGPFDYYDWSHPIDDMPATALVKLAFYINEAK